MIVDALEPSVVDKFIHEQVVPVPLPREPALQFALRRDDGRTHGGNEQVAERVLEVSLCVTAVRLSRAGTDLIPARQLARVPVRLLVDNAARDERAAALERRARSFFNSFGFSPSSVWRSSSSEGPARARCRNSRAQLGSVRSIRSISARQIGSSSVATASVTSMFLPRWTARMG